MAVISGTVYDSAGQAVAGRTVRAYRRDTGLLLGATTSSDGTPVPGDADFAQVALLLHFDGADGATTTVDSSSPPKSLTFNGATSLRAAGAKFGAAGLAPSSSGGVTAASNPAFAIGAGDFTFECSFYVVAFSPGLAPLFNIGDFSNGALFRVQSTIIELFINGTPVSTPATVSVGAWHHIAFSRLAGTVSVFLDGVLQGSFAHAGSIPAAPCLVGVSAHNGGEYTNGYIDDLRLTVGLARYTANFTPAAAPFPNSAAATTPAVGQYSITTPYTGEVNVLCLDDAAGTFENDLVLRTVPV